MTKAYSRRVVFGMTAGALVLGIGATSALAQETVRIGLATKTWFPTVIAEAAQQQGLFEKEGINAELTVYQSGAETFTSLAAGSADVVSTSPNIIATGRVRGVNAKMVLKGSSGNLGWQLIVPSKSKLQDPKELNGKNVGITSAGSLSDSLARWTMQKHGINITTVPLGGGLAPNLISGNVDAAVIYSPLSFKVIKDGDGRSLIDYGSAMPAHLNSGFAASDAFIKDKPELLKKTVKALLGGLAYLQNNRADAVKLIAEINDIPADIAEQEYENVFLKLSSTGEMTLADVEQAFELYRLGGMKEFPPAADMFTNMAIPGAK